jgi:hypothetical protein
MRERLRTGLARLGGIITPAPTRVVSVAWRHMAFPGPTKLIWPRSAAALAVLFLFRRHRGRLFHSAEEPVI